MANERYRRAAHLNSPKPPVATDESVGRLSDVSRSGGYSGALPKGHMERFTISLDDRLARQFDDWIAERSYGNRSEAVRDLLRAELGRSKLEKGTGSQCVACLSYVFNHHERDLAERLTALQHDHHDLTASTMHVHLDHDHCLETVVLRGPTDRVMRFADVICAERGVHHGKLNLIGVETHEPHVDPGGRETRVARTTPHVHVKPVT